MVKCAVKSCTSRSEKDNKVIGITFHKVPTDQKRTLDWIKNIRLLRKETDWLPTNASVVCSKHFKDEHKIPPKDDKGRIRLSDKALPMVTDETETPLELEVDLNNMETDDAIVEILESPQKNKMRKTIKRLQCLSSKRLNCIKKLRQQNKRLIQKNNQLLDIINIYKRSAT